MMPKGAEKIEEVEQERCRGKFTKAYQDEEDYLSCPARLPKYKRKGRRNTSISAYRKSRGSQGAVQHVRCGKQSLLLEPRLAVVFAQEKMRENLYGRNEPGFSFYFLFQQFFTVAAGMFKTSQVQKLLRSL
ncbi:hypothetical protein KQX54_021560 [Cotesia glomerata]|uniref:Uncharacterized protein n=1 Tax=Cotesia glomerata TaxID=32391 RepID=A0AAV7IVH4_COTGL|nr:hypothetical protein KQX54_021560 [Cotesia glomerata]